MDAASVSGTKGKTAKSRRETAVQGTNDSSIISKCSMAAAEYFEDRYLSFFAAKMTRRAPLIHRGYYIRARTVDHILRAFLKQHSGVKNQIISLGAGFDSTYFRLKSEHLLQDTVFIEVDFPEVGKRKHNIINSQQALRGLLGKHETLLSTSPHIELNCTDYKILGVDLTQINTLEAALRMTGVDFDTPTLFLSECVMTYMTRRCSSAIVKWAAETFCSGVFVMYEQINPNDSFGLFMQNHFSVIGSPLKCINSFPTAQCQKQRFRSLGWNWCEAFDMNQFYHTLVLPWERNYVENLEPFDEYEEWHLKCSHYMVLCAYTGPCRSLISQTENLSLEDTESDSKPGPCLLPVPEISNTLKRFSHTSSLIDDKWLVTVGGFGEQDGRHQRLSDVAVTDLQTLETRIIKPELENIELPRMHHTAVALKDRTLILIGGRNSPVRPCSQVISMNMHLGKDIATPKSNSRLTESTDKLQNCNNIMLSSVPNTTTTLSKELQEKSSYTGHDEMHLMNTENKCEQRNMESNGPLTLGILDSSSSIIPGVCSDQVNVSSLENVSTETQTVSQHCPKKSSDSINLGSTHTEISENAYTSSGERTLVNTSNKNLACTSELNEITAASRSDQVSGCDMEYKSEELSEVVRGCVKDEGEAEKTHFLYSVVKQSGEIPAERWRHATVKFSMKGEDHVFLHGGRTPDVPALDDSFVLNILPGCWTKLTCTGESPGARQSHSASLWNRKIIVACGLDENLMPVNLIHILDQDTLSWKKFRPTTGVVLPRYSHTAHAVGDILILIGGVNLSPNNPGVALINLQTGAAQEYRLPVPSKERILMFHKHTSVLIGDGRVLIVGGGGNCFSFGTHLNLSPVVLDISACLKDFNSSCAVKP